MKAARSLVAAILLTCVTVESTGASLGKEKVRQSVLHEIERESGKDAKACGLVDLRADPAQAFACAQAADGTSNAYWVAVQIQGADSYVWLAAVREPSGKRLLLLYDSNPAGDPSRLNPRVSSKSCDAFIFNIGDAEPIACNRVLSSERSSDGM